MAEKKQYIAGLYCRLSKDDEQKGESTSIGTQRAIMLGFCQERQYSVYKVYVDDGYSGLNFDRPGFLELLEDVERGAINLVITKDLSRLGRDYIMTGYYSEIFFQTKGVRYIAIADNYDSLEGGNDIAPFKNILNDMYARDISKKVKNAKHQQAKQGLFLGGQAPYGYRKDPNNKNRLIIDPETAEVVKLIFSLAENGLGNIAIATELTQRQILAPSAYKFKNGDERYAQNTAIKEGKPYTWRYGTVGQIVNNRVYLGELASLKTETTNYKLKHHASVPRERQIITPNAHEAIITQEQFERVHQIRSAHRCPANAKRFNLFRNKLFCDCCGHPLTVSRKELKYRQTDMYLCMYHFQHPEICPKTHRIYHDMLYDYTLQQIRTFARSMKRRKLNSSIGQYASIEELTPEILDDVIERIEIGHVTNKSRPGSVIQIYWKLK